MQNISKMNTTQREKILSLFFIIVSIIVIFRELLHNNYFIVLIFTLLMIFSLILFFSNNHQNEKRKYKKIIKEKIVSSKLRNNEKIEYFFIAEYRCPNIYAGGPLMILDMIYKMNLCYIFITNNGIHLQEISRDKLDSLHRYIFYSYDDILSLKFTIDFPFGDLLKIILKNNHKVYLNIRKRGQFGFLEETARSFLLENISY